MVFLKNDSHGITWYVLSLIKTITYNDIVSESIAMSFLVGMQEHLIFFSFIGDNEIFCSSLNRSKEAGVKEREGRERGEREQLKLQ